MIVEDQSEVIDFLLRPETYGVARPVERVDTHISIVFLAGDRAYKLKRAVRFPYVDFSTRERRRRFCEAELALNRRTAPAVYRKVAPVTREPGGGLAIGGEGEVVDWLVVMTRFDQEMLFDRLAGRGELTGPLMDELAAEVARFHGQAERRADYGGYRGIAETLDGNAEAFGRHAKVFDAESVRRLNEESRAALAGVQRLLETRRDAGFVRRCHGDLHLRNICLFEGRPTLFDAIEFSDAFACIDVLYDLAFLLMDLEHRGLRGLANRVLNRYLALDADPPAQLRGLAALALFLSCRAAVRAHTGADAAASQPDADKAARMEEEARAYLGMALDFLRPPGPRLVAVGGLSGTGKTTLARGLAPALGAAPGAVVLRSDVIRKRLMGVDESTRLDEAAYAEPVTERVYGTIRSLAAEALAAGRAVVADAVYARPPQRTAIERAAREAGVPFAGLWLEAPPPTLEARVESRDADASDADAAVVRRQLDYDLGEIAWRRVDAARGPESTLRRAREALALDPGPGAGDD